MNTRRKQYRVQRRSTKLNQQKDGLSSPKLLKRAVSGGSARGEEDGEINNNESSSYPGVISIDKMKSLRLFRL